MKLLAKFGPAVGGTLVLAEVRGTGLLLEHSIAPIISTSLLEGDILRTSEDVTDVIGFASEQIGITLLPGTEFKLTALSHGKHFDLYRGKLEASVARQRPVRPTILKTSQINDANSPAINQRFYRAVTY
jgi:hypothetical protein